MPGQGARVLPLELVPVPGHGAQICARAPTKGFVQTERGHSCPYWYGQGILQSCNAVITFFQNEKEDVIAAMWRHVALNSKASEDQLAAYQNAIEALEV